MKYLNKANPFNQLKLSILLLASLLFSSFNVAANTSASANSSNLHDDWQQLVNRHVRPVNQGHSSVIDYKAMQQERSLLQGYLDKLSKVTQAKFDAWDKAQQLAFLINAYNAWTLELILTKYPNLKSIKDLGSLFSSPWDKNFIPLLDNVLSLNDIEHGRIRGSGRYNDPRIHFAVNCASIGCPALREEAYTADKLEQQLTEQTVRFLADKSRNYAESDTLYVSSIFKWYDDDFNAGFRNANTLEDFILSYPSGLKLTESQKLALAEGKMDIEFLDYNWQLNAVR